MKAWMSSNFGKFETELLPLINVRIEFLLNILKTNRPIKTYVTSRKWWTVDERSLTFEREVIVLILLFSLCFSVRKLWTNNFSLLVTIIVEIA